MEEFSYEGHVIRIISATRKGETVYYMNIDGRNIDFVSNKEMAKRISCRFIDVVTDARMKMLSKGWKSVKTHLDC